MLITGEDEEQLQKYILCNFVRYKFILVPKWRPVVNIILI